MVPVAEDLSRSARRRAGGGARRLLAGCLLFAVFLGAPPAARARTPEDDRIEELRREVEALRELLESGQKRLGELEREIRELTSADADAPPADATPSDPPGEPVVAEAPPAPAAEPEERWQVGYREGGGGFFLRSPDGNLQMRLLGYAQILGGAYHDDFTRADAPGDFSVRRARLDWLVDFGDRYTFFVEIDGGPGSTPGTSDFALVEAKMTTALLPDDRLKLVVGKYVSPFSTEDRISSRSLDTIERYVALNSLFLLPATDVQFGAMLRGKALRGGRLEWYAGIFNGNGRANDNLSDDNGDKELQLKLHYRVTERLKLGLGWDYSNEEEQSLQLRGLSFTPYTAIPIEGTRRGWTADFAWQAGPTSFRGEGIYFDFEDAGAELAGGFVQGGYFLRGDHSGGLQLILRTETAAIDSDRVEIPGDRIDAVTLGLNVFYGGNWRLQVNGIAEHYDGPSNLPAGSPRVEGEGWKPYLMTELQLKF